MGRVETFCVNMYWVSKRRLWQIDPVRHRKGHKVPNECNELSKIRLGTRLISRKILLALPPLLAQSQNIELGRLGLRIVYGNKAERAADRSRESRLHTMKLKVERYNGVLPYMQKHYVATRIHQDSRCVSVTYGGRRVQTAQPGLQGWKDQHDCPTPLPNVPADSALVVASSHHHAETVLHRTMARHFGQSVASPVPSQHQVITIFLQNSPSTVFAISISPLIIFMVNLSRPQPYLLWFLPAAPRLPPFAPPNPTHPQPAS